jgi:cysteinyl-tRNA synthetase
MSLRYLGEQIDLHGGGMDLIFPHHENEIAQSEAFTGKDPFVAHWVHNAMMQLGDTKMSKSIGNIVTLRHGLDSYGSDGLRVFVLNGHYRSPLTYSEEALSAAKAGADRLAGAIEAELVAGDGEHDVEAAHQAFVDAMADDLGTPQALAVLFGLAREINRARDEGRPAGKAQATLRELGGVLGLGFERVAAAADSAPFVELLIETRAMLRDKKEFELADQIRDRLTELGVALEDGRDGTTWRAAAPPREPEPEPGEETPLSKVESTLRF